MRARDGSRPGSRRPRSLLAAAVRGGAAATRSSSRRPDAGDRGLARSRSASSGPGSTHRRRRRFRRRQLDLGRAPAPRFVSAVEQAPSTGRGSRRVRLYVRRVPARDGAGRLRRLARARAGNYREAREAFEESLAVDPRGAAGSGGACLAGRAGAARGDQRQARPPRPAPSATTGPPLRLARRRRSAMHAELGLGLLALRRGDAAEAEAALDRALRAVPPQPVALVARYLLGRRPVAAGPACRGHRPLGRGRPERSAGDGPDGDPVLARRRAGPAGRTWSGGLDLLNRFVATVPVNHPLRGDALVQAGWIALERGAPDEAVRRFLEAEAAGPRPELRPQIRAGSRPRPPRRSGDTGARRRAPRASSRPSRRATPSSRRPSSSIADAAKTRGAPRRGDRHLPRAPAPAAPAADPGLRAVSPR